MTPYKKHMWSSVRYGLGSDSIIYMRLVVLERGVRKRRENKLIA